MIAADPLIAAFIVGVVTASCLILGTELIMLVLFAKLAVRVFRWGVREYRRVISAL